MLGRDTVTCLCFRGAQTCVQISSPGKHKLHRTEANHNLLETPDPNTICINPKVPPLNPKPLNTEPLTTFPRFQSQSLVANRGVAVSGAPCWSDGSSGLLGMRFGV